MNASSKIITILAVIACTILTLTVNAAPSGHYRWTDENGQLKYSDRPPKGIKAEFIKTSTIKVRKSSNDGASNADVDAAQPKIHDKLEIMPPKDPALCKQAQNNLKALEGARIRITEPDGSKRFLTEDEKEDQRDNARKFITVNC